MTLAKGLTIAGTVRELGTGQTLERYAARVRCVRSFEDVAEAEARQQFRALVDGLARRDVDLSDTAKRPVEHGQVVGGIGSSGGTIPQDTEVVTAGLAAIQH